MPASPNTLKVSQEIDNKHQPLDYRIQLNHLKLYKRYSRFESEMIGLYDGINVCAGLILIFSTTMYYTWLPSLSKYWDKSADRWTKIDLGWLVT
jgi:hypothetical protein